MSNHIYICSIKNDLSLFKRANKMFKKYCIVFIFSIILFTALYGLTLFSSLIFAAILAGSYFFVLYLNRTVLHSFYVNKQTFTVKILLIKGCKKKIIVHNLSEFKVSVNENFWYRYETWEMQFHYKNKLIFKQIDIAGWNKDKFLGIKKSVNDSF